MGKECRTLLWWVHLEEREHVEDLDVDGSIILIWILKKYEVGHVWFVLVEDRDRWRNVMNAPVNFTFHK
jgi:hypothetical protein